MFGSEGDSTNISMLTTAGLSFDLFNLLRIGAGVGPRFTINIKPDGEVWVYDSSGNKVDLDNAGEAFLKSPLAYRLTADLKLGKILVGLNYTLDTNYTFEKWKEFENIFNTPFDNGRMGISLLFSFF